MEMEREMEREKVHATSTNDEEGKMLCTKGR